MPSAVPPALARAALRIAMWAASIRRRLLPPRFALMELGTSLWPALCLIACARLRIAETIRAGPKTAAEIARERNLDPDALYRVLRLMCGYDIMREDHSGSFTLTRIGRSLIDSPVSPGPFLRYLGEPWQLGPWVRLDETLRTGKPVFEAMYGQPFFEFVREHADAASVFDGAMTSVSGLHAAAVCDAYDFSDAACVVDVGGGKGIQMSALLSKNRHLRGILYDFPHVVDMPNPELVSAELQGRCERVGGDFFQSVPTGGDVYLLSHILHDWDDQRAASILRACRAAMAPSAKLVIVECVIENGTNRWSQGHLTDLQMLLTLSGKERTAAEFAQLLTAAGFSLSRVLPIAAAESIVEALPLAG